MGATRVDAVAGGVLVVCWTSGFIGAELGAGDAPVATVLAWRTLVSAVVFGGWALARGERVRAAALPRQIGLGLLVQAVFLGGVFAAAGAGVAAGTSALVTAVQPLLVAALAGPLLGERTARRQLLGLLLGAAGVAVVVAGDLDGGRAAAWTYLLPLAALVGLSLGSVLERRWRPQESLLSSLAVQSATAAAVFGLVAATTGQFAPPHRIGFWIAIGWLVVLSALGGYGSYLFVLRRRGAVTASTLLYLTPPVTAIWAWLAFGQRPGSLTGPGLAVCVAGVTLALRSSASLPRRRTPAAAPPTRRTPQPRPVHRS